MSCTKNNNGQRSSEEHAFVRKLTAFALFALLSFTFFVNAASAATPTVQSIALVGSPVVNDTTVQYTVTFDVNANNITPDDFELTFTTASLGTPVGTISAVSAASGTSVTVTVNAIGGTGTLRLDLRSGTDIADDGGATGVAAFTGGDAHNVGVPVSLAISSGAGRETFAGDTFLGQVRAIARDKDGNRIPRIDVTFTTPTSGSSGTFNGSGTNVTTQRSNSAGLAFSTIITANNTVGDFDVVATIAGTSLTDSATYTIRPGGITVTPTSGLTTTEGGGTATFTAVLRGPPSADVTMPFLSRDLSEGTVSPASVVFNASNWSVPQTVTVTGVNDDVVDDAQNYVISTELVRSADANYNGVNPTNIDVSNTDDDTADIIVTPTTGLTTTEAGGTATFTVVLRSEPSADVTIGLSSSDTGEGTVSPASLVFNAVNWNAAQTVTVTGVDDTLTDGAQSYNIVTAAATSSDADYSGMNPLDVALSNSDNEMPGITVTPTRGLTTTEAGGTATFTVVLNTQPSADVTIGVSSPDTGEGTVSPASLVFTSVNWNAAQTVTVTGVDDAFVDGNQETDIVTAAAISSDTNYGGINPADVEVTNMDDDTLGITVTPTTGLTTSEAGGTATFTVVLTRQPNAGVTIGLSSSDTGEGTVSPASLVFTSAAWSTPRTVTVTGVDDALADGAQSYNIVTAAATSTDTNYSGFNPADVAVSNTDDEAAASAGITVTPTTGLTTTEAGGTATFTVVLNTQPSANVIIGLTSSDTGEGTVSPASLVFTSANWNVAQTVTVTGVDDALADGAQSYNIVTAAATSTDTNYSGTNPADVAVSNTDDDTAGITVTPTTGLTTTEAGGTATFTVVLDSQPTANVTIGLTSSDTGEGTVSPASLVFTSANWNAAQTVTVTGVDDTLADGAQSYNIVTAAAASSDTSYGGTNPADVAVSNTDDDTAGITVTPTTGLTTTEAGGTATFTVVLNTQPSANVTIGLTSSDTGEGTVSPASLVFTSVNWNAAQTVTVTGVDDALADGAQSYNIVTAAATSTDTNYSGTNPADVAVSNTDDDTAGITVTPTTGLTTTEAGGTATFTVVLNTQPSANVTIGLNSSDTGEGTVSPVSLVFTSANWNAAQTVTVTGVDDTLADGAQSYNIVTAAATSTDTNYSGINPADVAVSNTDDDTAGITVTPTTGLTTTEAGGTATFTVVLDSQPTADVTIGLTSSDTGEGTVSPASLVFTSANWNAAQTVTVTGVDDTLADGAQSYNIVTAAATSTDTNYSGINPADVAVSNTDDDADIAVSSSEGGAVATGGTDAQGSERVGVSKVVTYTITNSGGGVLTLTGTPLVSNLTNVDSSPTVSGPSPLTVAAMSTLSFTVTYTPTADGPFSFDLTILSDDADEGTYVISASGTARVGPSVEETEAVIVSYLQNRAKKILATNPNFIELLDGGLGSAGGLLGNFQGAGTADEFTFNFATSHSAVFAEQGAWEAEKLALSSPEGSSGSRKSNSFDVWTQIQGSRNRDGNTTSTILAGYFGAHTFITPNLIVGGLAQLDWSEEKNRTANSETEGAGWMVGPYLVGRLPEQSLSFEARAAWGQSSNDVSPDGTYTDDFDTERFLVAGKVSGAYAQEYFTLKPNASLSWYREIQEAYTDGIGQAIPEQTVSVGQLRFGPEFVGKASAYGDFLVEPSLGFSGVWDFDISNGSAPQNLTNSENRFHGRLDVGVRAGMIGGATKLNLKVFLDGIGADNYQTIGASLEVSRGF